MHHAMERKDIVHRLLREGIMVSAQELDTLNAGNIEGFIAGKKNQQSKADLKPALTVTVESHSPKRMDAKGLTQLYLDAFQKLRALLVKKVDAVSINKTKNVFSNVSIIAMVKSKTERGYIVEDETGEMEVVTDQAMDEDDVIAITGMVREGRLFAGEIEYPEIPFNRDIGKLHAKVFLGPSIPADAIADAFLVNGDAMVSPSVVTLSRGDEKATILFCSPGNAAIHQAGTWLKRRQIHSWAPLVLDPIPDVIWVHAAERGSSLHKGVLVVSPGPGALVDMETKEVQFLGAV